MDEVLKATTDISQLLLNFKLNPSRLTNRKNKMATLFWKSVDCFLRGMKDQWDEYFGRILMGDNADVWAVLWLACQVPLCCCSYFKKTHLCMYTCTVDHMYTWLRIAQGLPDRNYCVSSGGCLLIMHNCAFPSSMEKTARSSSIQRSWPALWETVRWAGELALLGYIWFALKWLSSFSWSLRVFALSHTTNARTETHYECSHWDTLRMFALRHYECSQWDILRMFALRHITNVRTETRYECSHWDTLRMFALRHYECSHWNTLRMFALRHIKTEEINKQRE
jgi:hypothetical protein